MSASKHIQCVFCTFSRSVKPARTTTRNFSSSSTRSIRRKPQFPSVKADLRKKIYVEKEEIEKNFTPEQQASIFAANKVLGRKNKKPAHENVLPWSLNYYDDLTQVDPVVDHPVKTPWTNLDDNSRLKTDEELDGDFYKLMKELPDDPEKADDKWREFDQKMRLTIGKEAAERSPRSALAPELPKMGSRAAAAKTQKKPVEGERQDNVEPSPALLRLMQMTGLSRRDIFNLRVKSVVRHRVVNQTRMGKIQKQYVLSVAGNGNGLIGIGEGKSEEPSEALIQSQYRAIRSMQPILRYEGRTIFGDVKGKVSATELELYTRPPGFGLRCQQYIWEICRCAGITDLAARVTRSRNPMNTVKATVQALMSQKDPEDVARARGKKMVDVRKVYYAGAL